MPRNGTSFSRAKRIASIFPSIPRSPKPPGTKIPSAEPIFQRHFQQLILVNQPNQFRYLNQNQTQHVLMLLQQKYRHLVIQHIYQPAQFCFLFKLRTFSSNARHSVMSAAGASNFK